MKPGEFIDRLDDARVVEAIRQAESKTSGEIRVFISRRTLGRDNLMTRAATRFRKLGMDQTPERNGVLLYFMPKEQKFAVIGDMGINAQCGVSEWEKVAAELKEGLRQGQVTEAVVGGVASAGALLARHFPARPGDRNDLPNEVSRD
ncbi:TPM domain-containing protein [soil metagenome]